MGQSSIKRIHDDEDGHDSKAGVIKWDMMEWNVMDE